MKEKITWIAYISFAFIGTVFMLQGVMKIEMAADFKIPTYWMQSVFTIFTIADTIAIYLNKYFIKIIKLKNLIIIAIIFILIGTLGMILSKGIILFSIFMFIYGFATGIFVSLGNYLIISLYDEFRAQKLNMLNFSYAFGSLLTPGIAAYLVDYNISWRLIFMGSLFFPAMILILTFLSDFSVIRIEKEEYEKSEGQLSLVVILIGFGMFFYVNSEMIFNNWAVEFFYSNGIDLKTSKYSLSVYWIFIAVGRFMSGTILKNIKPYKYIFSFSTLAIFSFFIIFFTKNVYALFAIVALMGFAYSGLYANLLTYGTELGGVSPSIMTFYISMGSMGGILSSPLSGIIRKYIGVSSCIASSMFFMFGIIAVTFSGKYIKNKI